MTARRAEAAERLHLPPGSWPIIGVATLGSFMAQLDATVVNVSLSTLARDLHTGLPTIQWVMSGYLLALALVLPLNGWLVDRIGSRAVYLWCFAAFTLTSFLCALAWSAPALIVLRLLQGASGGLLAPMAQLTTARIAGRQLPRISALMTVPILLAPMLSPVVAGIILQHASWRWLFLINLPFGILAFGLGAAVLPRDDSERHPRPFDLAGLLMLSPAIVLFLIGTDRLREPTGPVLLVAGLLLIALYGRHALRRRASALVDIRLFRRPLFSVAAGTMFLVNGVMFAGQMLIPLFLIQGRGISPVQTGWLMLPLGLGMMATFLVLGRLTDKFGIRVTAIGGALIALAGTVPLAILASSGLSIGVLAASLFLRGVGIGAISVPANSTAYAATPREELAGAATTLNIGQRLGGPTCTTICATFLAWQSGKGVVADQGFAATFWLLAAIHLALVLAALPLPKLLPETSIGSDGGAQSG